MMSPDEKSGLFCLILITESKKMVTNLWLKPASVIIGLALPD